MKGITNYGGMTGRDMETPAIPVKEALDFHYIKHRVEQVEYLGNKLIKFWNTDCETNRWSRCIP